MLLKRILRSNFLIKLRSWEYWPFGIVQAPFFIYWIWLSIKSRSLLFFSASNPGILTGGMFGESKFDVLNKIPAAYKPRATLINHPASLDQVQQEIRNADFSFPLIFKPDIGERGWMVKKIQTNEDISEYLRKAKFNFIIQEYIQLPLEFSVFYHRHPNETNGRVTSVTMKQMLSVTGDGLHTLEELILSKDRAKLQWEVLKNTFSAQLKEIPVKGREIELVPIGNHCLGTTFINRNDLITETLSSSFDKISKQVDGFFFGRYDIRAASFEDLEDGKIMIMELNGCGAEPSHIYQPGASLRKALIDLYIHWKTIYDISRANHKHGVAYLPLAQGIEIYKRFKAATTL